MIRTLVVTATALTGLAVLPPARPTPPAARAQRADTLRLEVGGPHVNGTYYPAHVGHNTIISVQGGRHDTTATWTNTLEIGDSAGIAVHRWHTGGNSRTQAGVPYRLDIWQTFDARSLELYGYHLRTSLGGETRFTVSRGRVQGTQRLASGTVNELDFTLSRPGFPGGAADLIPPAVVGGLREGLVILMPVWSVPSRNVVEQTWKVVRRTTVEIASRTAPAWELEIFSAAGTLTGRIWLTGESPYMVRWDVINPQGDVVTRMIGEDGPR